MNKVIHHKVVSVYGVYYLELQYEDGLGTHVAYVDCRKIEKITKVRNLISTLSDTELSEEERKHIIKSTIDNYMQMLEHDGKERNKGLFKGVFFEQYINNYHTWHIWTPWKKYKMSTLGKDIILLKETFRYILMSAIVIGIETGYQIIYGEPLQFKASHMVMSVILMVKTMELFSRIFDIAFEDK